MAEKPILFSAPMVRALLAGTKSQTRRPLKPQPAPNHPHDGGTKWVLKDVLHVPVGSVGHLSVREKQGLRCPYGQPGDRLWVRESFRGCRAYEVRGYAPSEWGNKPIWFEADGRPPGNPEAWAQRAKPSIHMPCWASRITLEITDVRVERLQDISGDDAAAEGWPGPDAANSIRSAYPVAWYSGLWDQINGAGSWDANPWVWVVQFRVASPINT